MPFALWHAAARFRICAWSSPYTRPDRADAERQRRVPASPGLRELGVEPTPVDAVLQQFRGHG